MLITIDTTKDSAEAITAACEFAKVVISHVPTGTAPQPPAVPVVPPLVVVSAQAAHDELAAKIFAANSTVVVPPPPLDSTPAAAPSTVAAVVPAAPALPMTDTAVSPSSVPPAIPAPPGAAPVVERDANGIPYDARIHNKSRTKKQDGTWKLAKGIDPVVVAAVLQELTGSTATTVVPSAPLVPAAPEAPAPSASVAPSVAIPPAPPATAGSPAITFRGTMAQVNAATSAGKITKADVDAALVEVGLKADELAPLVLPNNRALLEAFHALLSAKIGA